MGEIYLRFEVRKGNLSVFRNNLGTEFVRHPWDGKELLFDNQSIMGGTPKCPLLRV